MLGIEDIWGNPDNITVIERGERFTDFPSGLKIINVNITIGDDFARKIEIR